MSKFKKDKIQEIEDQIIQEVKLLVLARLYGSEEKVHLSKEEKVEILSKIQKEVELLVMIEHSKLESRQVGLEKKQADWELKQNRLEINFDEKISAHSLTGHPN